MQPLATSASPSRCTEVAVASTIAWASVTELLLGGLSGPPTTAPEAVVDCCVLALVACTAWAWLATLAVVVEAWTGHAGTPSLAIPALLRRLVMAGCGVALVGALSQSATAGTTDPSRDPLAGLPMPERAIGQARAHDSAAPTVVVRPGDCLWSIAAAQLGTDSDAVRVAAQWRRIYRLNRAVIGPDPDLIRPGQRLQLPPAS